jgi:putative ABC transport system permease protein
MALEYGTLGLLAGAIGGLASVALSWVVASRVLDIRWDPSALYVAAGVVITGLTVTVVGVVASVDVLRRKPLSVLRAE